LGLRLPIEVSLEASELKITDTEPIVEPRSAASPATSDTPGEQWERDLARRHGVDAIAELARARLKTDQLDDQIEGAKADLAARTQEMAAALASGKASATGDRAAAAALRPVVPSRAWALSGLALASLILVAEAWQLAIPFLNGAGIDVGELGVEYHRNPVSVLLCVAFAAGCTAMLVAFAHVALGHGRRALYEETVRRQRAVDAIVALASGLLAASLAWLLGALRRATTEAGLGLSSASAGGSSRALPLLVFVLVAAGLPFFTAMLWSGGRVALAHRDEIAARARTFDLALRAKEEERERLEERIRLARSALFDLEVERAGAKMEARRLASLGEEATREATEEAWLAGEALVRAREELRAVLETDRYAFLKAAGKAGRRDLAEVGAVALRTRDAA
jgi:hypothetical protein